MSKLQAVTIGWAAALTVAIGLWLTGHATLWTPLVVCAVGFLATWTTIRRRRDR